MRKEELPQGRASLRAEEEGRRAPGIPSLTATQVPQVVGSFFLNFDF